MFDGFDSTNSINESIASSDADRLRAYYIFQRNRESQYGWSGNVGGLRDGETQEERAARSGQRSKSIRRILRTLSNGSRNRMRSNYAEGHPVPELPRDMMRSRSLSSADIENTAKTLDDTSKPLGGNDFQQELKRRATASGTLRDIVRRVSSKYRKPKQPHQSRHEKTLSIDNNNAPSRKSRVGLRDESSPPVPQVAQAEPVPITLEDQGPVELHGAPRTANVPSAKPLSSFSRGPLVRGSDANKKTDLTINV